MPSSQSHGPTTLEEDRDIQLRFQTACKALGEWLRRRGVPKAWIYCHENPDASWPNLHMLIHLPHNLFTAFFKAAVGWFDALEGGIHLRPRWGPTDRCMPYMVKGTDFIAARCHGATAKRQGPVDFKRAGWSKVWGRRHGYPANPRWHRRSAMPLAACQKPGHIWKTVSSRRTTILSNAP